MKAPFFLYAFAHEQRRIQEMFHHLTDYQFKLFVLDDGFNPELVLRTTNLGGKVDFKLLTSLIYLHEKGAITFSYEVKENKVNYNILTINRKVLDQIYAKPSQAKANNDFRYTLNALSSDITNIQTLLENQFSPYGIKQSFIDHELGTFQSVNFQLADLNTNQTNILTINALIFEYCQAVSVERVNPESQKKLLEQFCSLFSTTLEAMKEDLFQQWCFVLYKYEIIGLSNCKPVFAGIPLENSQFHGQFKASSETITSASQFIENKYDKTTFENFIKTVTSYLQSDENKNYSLSTVDAIKLGYSKLTIFGISKHLQSLSEVSMAIKAKEIFNICAQNFHFFGRSNNFMGAMTADEAEVILNKKISENPKFHFLLRSSASSPDTLTLSCIFRSRTISHYRVNLKLENLQSSVFGLWVLKSNWGPVEVTINYPKTFEQAWLEEGVFYDAALANKKPNETASKDGLLTDLKFSIETVNVPYEVSLKFTSLFAEWKAQSKEDFLAEINNPSTDSMESDNNQDPFVILPEIPQIEIFQPIEIFQSVKKDSPEDLVELVENNDNNHGSDVQPGHNPTLFAEEGAQSKEDFLPEIKKRSSDSMENDNDEDSFAISSKSPRLEMFPPVKISSNNSMDLVVNNDNNRGSDVQLNHVPTLSGPG